MSPFPVLTSTALLCEILRSTPGPTIPGTQLLMALGILLLPCDSLWAGHVFPPRTRSGTDDPGKNHEGCVRSPTRIAEPPYPP